MLSLETGLNEPSFPSHCSLNKVSGFQAHIHTSSWTGSVLISDPKIKVSSHICNGFWLWRMKVSPGVLSLLSVPILNLSFQSYYLWTPKPCPSALISQNGSPPLHNTLFLSSEPVHSLDTDFALHTFFWLLSLQFPAVSQYVFINWWNKTCVGNLTFSKYIWRISFSNEVKILVYNLKNVKYF